MILTLSKDNFITVLDSLAEAERQPDAEHFSSLDELTELAANWPASRLVEIWNNLPGVTPVKKFKDRPTAVTRIWKTLAAMNASTSALREEAETAEMEPAVISNEVAAQTETTEPSERETSTPAVEEDATVAPQAADVAPEGQGSANETTPAKPARTGAPREGSKAEIILALLKREGGASLQEIMDATGWQKHSVRGFLAGTVNKKMALELVSRKDENKERRYFIEAQKDEGGVEETPSES
jgi:hypothetical protein